MKPAYLIILLLMNLSWAAVYSAYKVVGQDLSTGGIVTIRFAWLQCACLLPGAVVPVAPRRDHNTCL
jgi:drug/metabolite transporter (DMT)-like permease